MSFKGMLIEDEVLFPLGIEILSCSVGLLLCTTLSCKIPRLSLLWYLYSQTFLQNLCWISSCVSHWKKCWFQCTSRARLKLQTFLWGLLTVVQTF